MSETPSRSRQPTPSQKARALYGEAFEATRPELLAESITDWASLSEAERSFSMAHLTYLNIQAHSRVAYHLIKARQQLAELSQEVGDLLEDLTSPGEDEDASQASDALAPEAEGSH